MPSDTTQLLTTAPMLSAAEEISSRFELNLSRVQNLLNIYRQLLKNKEKAEGVQAHDSDILRAALVLLHAALEDFLRSLLIWKLPGSGRDALDKVPILGSEQKRPSQIGLGSLIHFRGRKAEEIIRASVEAYVEQWASFNNIGQIKGALIDCGLDPTGFNYDELHSMVLRRHNIVHRADANNRTRDEKREYSPVRPISLDTLVSYATNVKEFERFVGQQLKAVDYFPVMNPERFSNAILYLVDHQHAKRNELISAIGISRSRAGMLIHDLLTMGYAKESRPDRRIHSCCKNIEEASQLLGRFCKNHAVYKELSRDQAFANYFTESQFVQTALRVGSINFPAKAPTEINAKTLLRFFWAAGYITSKGDRLELSGSNIKANSILSAAAFSRRQFNMFFGETSPPNVVNALKMLIKQSLSREDAESQLGRNSIYALAKLGLISVDGTPSIPASLRKRPLEDIVRLAAKENHVVAFVCDLLEAEPKLSGVEIGTRVAEEFGCNWVRKSKQRNGASLGRWASWVKAGENEERRAPVPVTDVGELAELLKNMDESEFGSLIRSGRYSDSSKQLSQGRQAKINKEMAEACMILRNTHHMTMAEISERVGVSRAAIYRALDRFNLNSKIVSS